MSGLTPFEAAHAQSILDATPVLAPIPPVAVPHLRIGAVIRKPPAVLRAFLACLAAQRHRAPCTVSYDFTTDFGATDPFAADSLAVLEAFAAEHDRVTIRRAGNAGGDYGEGAQSRQWTPQAWHRVGALKNAMIQAALNDRSVEGLWLVDADVCCDTTTLQSLRDLQSPIAAAVYWTQWRWKEPGDTLVIHAAPQVWLRHPYILSGHGYTEASFRAALVERKVVKVGGLGACTLFHRSALEKGVSFQPVPEGLPPGPMADGEDRHLCERARRLHLPLLADAWPDIWHAYHPREYDQLEAWVARLTAPHPEKATLGDWVSVKIEPLEPFPHPADPKRLQYFGAHFARGRLGAAPWLPELTEAAAGLRVGERQIVTLHYPAHYEYPTLRGAQRLVAVTLLDTKPFRYAPVIERELLVGASGARLDATTLTAAQIDDIQAVAA